MRKVYKYPIPVQDECRLMLPASHQFLSVQVINGTPCLYALVDDSGEKVEVVIRTYGTGHEIDPEPGLEYVGTYVLYEGRLVYHVFVEG